MEAKDLHKGVQAVKEYIDDTGSFGKEVDYHFLQHQDMQHLLNLLYNWIEREEEKASEKPDKQMVEEFKKFILETAGTQLRVLINTDKAHELLVDFVIWGRTIKEEKEEDDEWTDPAGGEHYGREEDPAAQYE